METNETEKKRWNNPSWVDHWPKRERFTATVTPMLLAALDLRPAERVLDIGCGGGLASIAAAGMVGNGGAVTGADVSVGLVALASRRAAEAGVGNVSFHVKDVQQDRVAGAPFDVAMSQFGVMFFDEPRSAFTNIRAQLAGGMMTKAAQEPAPHWLYYVTVDAADAAAARVKNAGGQVLNGPLQVPGGGWMVQALDPQGAKFGMLAPQR